MENKYKSSKSPFRMRFQNVLFLLLIMPPFFSSCLDYGKYTLVLSRSTEDPCIWNGTVPVATWPKIKQITKIVATGDISEKGKIPNDVFLQFVGDTYDLPDHNIEKSERIWVAEWPNTDMKEGTGSEYFSSKIPYGEWEVRLLLKELECTKMENVSIVFHYTY